MAENLFSPPGYTLCLTYWHTIYCKVRSSSNNLEKTATHSLVFGGINGKEIHRSYIPGMVSTCCRGMQWHWNILKAILVISDQTLCWHEHPSCYHRSVTLSCLCSTPDIQRLWISTKLHLFLTLYSLLLLDCWWQYQMIPFFSYQRNETSVNLFLLVAFFYTFFCLAFSNIAQCP